MGVKLCYSINATNDFKFLRKPLEVPEVFNGDRWDPILSPHNKNENPNG